MQIFGLLIGSLLLVLFTACLWLPFWWLTVRLDPRLGPSLARVPVSLGFALVAYISFVNLIGKLLQSSLQPVLLYLSLNLAACILLFWKQRASMSLSHVWRRRRSWFGILLLAIVLGLPQWFQAVSGNRWDEMASSSLHITAANQFAEDVFPPRHNAFPDIVAKYHYGFTLLSGTVHWVTKWSSNVSIDIASTALWLFIFLFTYGWMRQLRISRIASVWGGFATLLGGGLSWLYLQRLQVYEGYQKLPVESTLIHRYDPEMSWWSNLITVMENQNIHLKNADGNIFPLPFDIAIHYQQHAVALGIALTLVAAYVFWIWQTRRDFAPALLLVNIVCFGLVFLGHAVFGSIASASAGLVILVLWLREPSRIRFLQGILFTVGVTVVAFLHGGMLARGDEYGPPGAPVAIRQSFGYISGSLLDQLNWNLAGFGLPLILALVALWVWLRQQHASPQRSEFLAFFGIFALISFLIPQLLYFSHAGGVEEQTEISKFFFCTHLSVAMLSVIGVDYLVKRLRWWAILPFFAMTAVSPLATSIAGSLDKEGNWLGFYKSPYDWQGGKDHKAVGEALYSLKKSNRDQYYDFSTTEVSSGYLNELLVFGGSVFSLSPTRYEVTGFGYLIAEDRVAHRILQEGGLARLLPGSAEDSGTDWLYAEARENLAVRPVIVRSRFAKLIAEGMLVKRYASGPRELFEFKSGTAELDKGIEHYWSPKVVTQTHADWNGDGKTDLVFFDYRNGLIIVDSETIALPPQPNNQSGFPLILVARFPGDQQVDVLVGQMADPVYRRGETVAAMVRQYPFMWQRLDRLSNRWQQPYQYGFWSLPADIPLLADYDRDGYDDQLIYRPSNGAWFRFPSQIIDGPSLPSNAGSLPVVGRFLPGSTVDLAVWSPLNGRFKLKSAAGGNTFSMEWGGQEGDVLLPGDYDGDGYDEVGIWQPHSGTWWVRKLPLGPNLRFNYGTSSGVPVPADYDGDGRIDLAYWEPEKHTIYVSFDLGQSTGVTITVPPDSIPVFVQMY